jgi:membrane fusion protein, copper/silver efflux system
MNKNIILAVIVALSAGGAGGYWIASRGQHDTVATPTAQTNGKGAGDRKVLYWHDPMVPGQKFDKPGKSPFMDMQLVPVYADEASDSSGGVSISPRVVQNLGVRLAEVKQVPLELGFTAVGAVSIDERTLSAVQARVNGYVERLYVRAQYDPVTGGQRLVDIYSPEWLSAQEEFLALKSSAQPGVTALADAARQRLALLGVSDAQLKRIEQSGKPDPRVSLFAPQGGLVWELGVREGMAVNPGMTLFRLASLGSVWVHAELPETQSALVKPGVFVEAKIAALPDRVYKGTVAALLPDVNATTRTVKARIVLANRDGRLRPGMFANLSFSGASHSALTVPAEAVIYTGQRKVVIVADSGKFRPVEVETGRESGDVVEIVRGVKAGDKVVASGQFLIDSEASLKSTLSRLDSGAAESPAGTGKPSSGHAGHGKVTEIDPRQGRVTLSHGPIPSMKWPEMTMGFRVEPPSQLAGIGIGDEVDFELRGDASGGDYTITRIAKSRGAGK